MNGNVQTTLILGGGVGGLVTADAKSNASSCRSEAKFGCIVVDGRGNQLEGSFR